MKENSIENLQNKKYFRNIDEAIKVYEEFRRFKDKGFIKSIDPDFFFNLTDMFLSDYKRTLKENEELKLYNNSITSELEQMTTEKFKDGWFHQSEFKGLISVKKVKDKIEEM